MSGFFSSIGEFFLEVTQTVVVVLSIFLILYLFIMQPHQVNGLSMYPNFDNGEYLLTDKISYKTGTPQRGDVVVFHAPEAAQCPQGTGCDFIKRIIAVPGESVEVKNNGYYINGEKLVDQYVTANRHVKTIHFVSTQPSAMSRVELDFFNNLKRKYQPFGIGVEHLSHEKAHEKRLEMEGRSSGLSL